jgi:transcriptional regulator with XRE-family HTH domain
MPDERPVIPELVDRQKAEREQRKTIRLARERAGLTQAELVNLVYKSKRVRLSQSKLSIWEGGYEHVSLSPKEIRAIESVLVKALGRKEPVKSVLSELIGPGLFDNGLRNLLMGIEPSPAVDKRVTRKQLLQRAGISQSAVAKELGIYRSKLNEWVNGKIELSSEEEAKLNEVVGAAEHKKNREDPYYLLESAHRILDEVWPAWQSAEGKVTKLEKLVELYRQLDASRCETGSQLPHNERDRKYIEDLESQNKLLREYLDSRQVASLANATAEELSDKAHSLPNIVQRPKNEA